MTNTKPNNPCVTVAEFQKLIREMYFAKDQSRGIPGTFMWLMEEVGELSTALRKDDPKNLSENLPTFWRGSLRSQTWQILI